MLVAVIADTHLPRGRRRLPAECVERLAAADLILHAGDLVSTSFLEQLRAIGPPVEAVHGNMDEPALRLSLPEVRVVEAGGARLALLHDAGAPAGLETRLAARFPDCGAVVYGHTHAPSADRVEDVWILNPGSPTERRRAPAHAMLLLDIEDGRIAPELIILP